MIKSAKDIGIGIIGVGIMGRGHALYFSDYVKGGKVVAIYDANQQTAQKVAKEVFKKTKLLPKVYDDLSTLLEDQNVKAVIIESRQFWQAKMSYVRSRLLQKKRMLEKWQKLFVTLSPLLELVLCADLIAHTKI
jgi:6-phosphogluconate dehydrogenase